MCNSQFRPCHSHRDCINVVLMSNSHSLVHYLIPPPPLYSKYDVLTFLSLFSDMSVWTLPLTQHLSQFGIPRGRHRQLQRQWPWRQRAGRQWSRCHQPGSLGWWVPLRIITYFSARTHTYTQAHRQARTHTHTHRHSLIGFHTVCLWLWMG